MSNKHKKIWSNSLIIREIHVKTTMKCHFKLIRMAKYEVKANGAIEIPQTAGKNVNSYNQHGE